MEVADGDRGSGGEMAQGLRFTCVSWRSRLLQGLSSNVPVTCAYRSLAHVISV
jgi:hypothetical protein